MASLTAIGKGIALSPFRATAMAGRGAGRLAKTGVKALGTGLIAEAGLLPLLGIAAGIGIGTKKAIKTGASLFKPGKDPSDVTKDSALQAIAKTAAETSKINAEARELEAEALQKTSVQPQTTMGGMDVEILEKIYGEVVSIRGLMGDKSPESEKRELALDEEVRHKKFLAALASLGFGGKAGGKEGDEKEPSLFGNLLDTFKKFLPLLLAGLGLAGLVALWPKLEGIIGKIGEAIDNINEFIDDMAAFFGGLGDWLGGLPPSTAAAIGGAVRGTKSHQKASNKRNAMLKERRLNRKLKKAQQAENRKRAAKRLATRRAAQRAAQLKRIKLANEKAAQAKADAKAKRAAAQKLLRSADAKSMKGLGRFNWLKSLRSMGQTVPKGVTVPGATKPSVKPSVVKRPPSPTTKPVVRTPQFDLGERGQEGRSRGTSNIRPWWRTPGFDEKRGQTDTQRTTRGGPGRWFGQLRAAAALRMGNALGGGQVLPDGGKLPAPVIELKGRGGVEKPGARATSMVEAADILKKARLAQQRAKLAGAWQSMMRATSRAPFVNPITMKPMTSRYYYNPKTGNFHDMLGKGKGHPMVKQAVALEYFNKNFGIKPGKKDWKLTAQQLKLLGEKPGFINRMQGSMKWAGRAAGPVSLVFLGYAIKNAFQNWQANKTKGDMNPFDDSSQADTNFRIDMSALAASFGVGWVAAILSGMLGTAIGGPIGGFFLGLLGGITAGLMADQITRWLLGEGVESTGVEGVKEGAIQTLDQLMAYAGSFKHKPSEVETYQLNVGQRHELEEKLNIAQKQEDKFRDRARGDDTKMSSGVYGVEGKTWMQLADEKKSEITKIQDKLDFVPDMNESGGSLGGSSRAIPLPSAAGREGGQSMPGVDQFDPSASVQTTANKLNSIQTTPDNSGTSLAAAGKNGGVESPDVIVMASNYADNRNSTESVSTATTSTVITAGTPSTSLGNQPLSHRYGVA